MKIKNVAKKHSRPYLSDLQAKVLDYIERHPGEVFTYRDEGLAQAVGAKPSTLGWVLWWLHHRHRLIDKIEVDGKIYFGSRRAVAEFKRRLGVGERDIVAEARALQERIRGRGKIDVVALLDEVRGPWE